MSHGVDDWASKIAQNVAVISRIKYVRGTAIANIQSGSKTRSDIDGESCINTVQSYSAG